MSNYFVMTRRFAGAISAAALLTTPALVSAATISGQTSTTAGAPVAGVDVRLWAPNSKGWAIVDTVQSDSVGQYSFPNVTAGDYKVDARGAVQNFADLWFDVEAPNSGGLVGEDADVITVTDTSIRSDVTFALPSTGSIFGMYGASLTSFGIVRAESTTDPRYHHNTERRVNPFGAGHNFGFRGLISTADGHQYRLLGYSPSGEARLSFFPNPIDVVTGADTLASVAAQFWPPDVNEPNDTLATGVAVTALPFQSAGANVKLYDVDWYCLTAAEGDRFIVRANTTITIDGQQRKHPWLDPILGFYDSAGTQLSVNDDETPGNGFEPMIDTGILTAGDYCFVVSTFGDGSFNGNGQSSGDYTFEAEMGNREPVMTVTQGGMPVDPMTPLNIDEGGTLTVDVAWSDVDGDMLMVDATVEDVNGNPITITFTNNGMDGSLEWTPSQTAANDGPYTLKITVTDGEFVEEMTVTVTVNMVNITPTVPILDSPIGGARVNTSRVDLTVQNSTDPDLDALTYEYEVDIGASGGLPEQTGSAPENNSGLTLWTTDPIPDNTSVLWRARANDGNGQSGISAWSAWESFFVDRMNEPPSTPVILKPANNEIVPVTAPRISVVNPVDPEGDDIVVRYEIATDSAFTSIVASSSDIAVTTTSMNVEWTTDPALTDGASYFVRAQAEDDLGATSPWSDVSSFRIPSLELPDVPKWTGDFAMYCAGGVFDLTEIPESIEVANVDASGDTVDFQFQILEVGVTEPVYDITVAQSVGATTVIPIDTEIFEENALYTFRIRTVRGDELRDWRGCEVRLNQTDDPAQVMAFTAPEDGTVFSGPAEVGARILPPFDVDSNEQLELRICGSRESDFGDCADSPADWQKLDFFDAEALEVEVPELDYGQSYQIQACALNLAGECVMEDEVAFSVSNISGGTEDDGCGCASGTNGGGAAPAGLLALAFLFGRIRRRRG